MVTVGNEATMADVLARLEAMAAAIEGLRVENAALATEIARLTSAPPGVSGVTSTGGSARTTGRRGMLRSLLTASAAGALLAIAKEAATVQVAHADPIFGSTSNAGIAAVYGTHTASTGLAVGVRGEIGSTTNDSAAVYGTASTLSGQTYGVQGVTSSSTVNATGVKGDASGPGTNGVWGTNTSTTSGATGVFGTATATSGGAIGVWGRSSGTDAAAKGVYGVIDTAGATGTGVYGQSTGGIGVYGLSSGNYGMQGVTTKTGYAGLVGVGNQPGSAGFYALGVNGATAGTFQGNVVINGSLTVTGSYPKSAAVKKKDGTLARMYCVEAPESWFEDFGTATLVNGQASVALDPEFDEVVSGDDYRVFLTSIGDTGSLYVSRKGPHQFEVRSRDGATAKGSFDYRVVARRLDDVGKRMEKVEIPTMGPIDVTSLTQPAAPPKPAR